MVANAAKEYPMKNHPWNRREFIARPLTWFAAARLLKNPEFLFAEQASSAPGAAARKPLYRPLGKTGISLPVISMGVGKTEIAALVRRSYELGVRYFDTAASYAQGQNEVMLGSMIKVIGVRDKVVIATKVHMPIAMNQSSAALTSAQLRDAMQDTLDASLKRMQLDYVDIVLLHAASSAENVKSEGVLEAMNAWKKAGKARFIGVSSHSQQQEVLTAVTELGVHDVVMFGFNRTMASNRGLLEAMDAAYKKGIGLVTMKSLAGGVPGSEAPGQGGAQGPRGGPPQAGAEGGGAPQMQSPPGGSQSASATNPTALIKWVLQHESIATVISAFGTFEQVEQNFSVAYDLSYTDSERKFISDEKLVSQLEYCQQCGKCRSSCPTRADIPTLMRSHMYALQYRDLEKSSYALASIPKGKGLDACANCDICPASCVNTVNIARKIAELKTLPFPVTNV